MNHKTRPVIALLLGALALNCFAQAPTAPVMDQAQFEAARLAAKAEQEKALALAAANAEKLDKAIDALIAEAQAAVAANAPVKTYDALLLKLSSLSLGSPGYRDRYNPNPKTEILRAFLTHWQDYLYAVAQGNFEPAGQTLRQLIQEAATLPIIPRSDLMALQDQLATKITEADKAVLAPLLKKLDETFDSANAAGDFDGLLGEIGVAQAKEARSHPNMNSGAIRTLQGLRQFVTRWQEYLSLRDSGKTQDAQNILRNLTSDNNGYGADEITAQFRARIRKKLSEQPVAPVVKTAVAPIPEYPKPETLTLETMDGILSTVSSLERFSQGTDHPQLFRSLLVLVNARDKIRAHQGAQAVQSLVFQRGATDVLRSQTGGYAVALEAIRQKLIIQGIQLDFDAKLAPLPNELSTDYLKRLINVQIETKNWQAAYNIMNFATQLDLLPADYSMAIASFGELASGLNQEAAGQYAMAALSYFGALHSTSTLVPMKQIADRLDKLKAEHPKEYEEAFAWRPRMVPPGAYQPPPAPIPSVSVPRT